MEPYRFANVTLGGANVTDIMRDAILAKYSLIRYYYTQFFLLSTTNGGTFYKPVFFEYPNDPLAYQVEPSENVMLGSALKLSIKTKVSANVSADTNAYFFSGENWCDILRPDTPCHYGNGTSTMVSLPANISDY
jgi:alpha-glucosidase (family GH31 glycosyl hydrolase)